jgi:hypothetical protein
MKERSKFWVIPLILILSFVFYLGINFLFAPSPSLSPPLQPDLPENCSVQEVQAVWNSIFQNIGPDEPVILTNSQTINGHCEKYFAYKTISFGADYTDTLILSGITLSSNTTLISAYRGNFSGSFMTKLLSSTSYDTLLSRGIFNSTTGKLIDNAFFSPPYTVQYPRMISSNEEANTTFKATFKEIPENWVGWVWDETYPMSYTFNKTFNDGATKITNKGVLIMTYAYDLFFINFTFPNFTSACVENWQPNYTLCTLMGETSYQSKYYKDNNGCGNPLNTTLYPDNGTLITPCTICNAQPLCSYTDCINNNRTRTCTNGCLITTTEIQVCNENETSLCGSLGGNPAMLKIQQLESAGNNVVKRENSPVYIGEYFVIPETNGVYLVINITNQSSGYSSDFIKINNSVTTQPPIEAGAVQEGLTRPILGNSTYNISYSGSSSSSPSSRFITVDFPQTDSNHIGTFYCSPTACVPSWSCGAWGACSSSGTQTRTCTDLISCASPQTETQSCAPTCTNYTSHNNTCTSDDTFTTYYTCTSSGTAPTNITNDCDYNHLGVIGVNSDVHDTNVQVEVFIDDDPLNTTKNYTGDERAVEIFDNDDNLLASFDYDFSSPLNLRAIDVIKQPSSSHSGYLIINGLEDIEKTFYVNKKDNASTKVCARNRDTSGYSTFSNLCTGNYEHLVNCPGSTDNYTCSLSGNVFTVSGLTHSAVREMGTSPPPGSCIPLWNNCTSWAPTPCTSGQSQTRTCTDSNHCGTNVGKPPETQACPTPPLPSCTESWTCTGYSSCVDGQKTRTCTDSNHCGTVADKPDQTSTCISSSTDNTTLIIIIVAGVLIILIIAVILILLLTKKKKTGPPRREYDSRFNVVSPSQPPRPPMMPRYPIQQNQFRPR